MTDRHTVDTITSDALDTLYQRAETAETALKRVRALAVYNRDHTAVGIDDYQIGQHELAVAVLDILQPGPAATLCPHGCDTTHCPCLACEDDQRQARRISLRVLINRVNHGQALTPAEAQLLARHVATEICDANTARQAERAVEDYRGALSHALGLGTGAPWGAIHERAIELYAAEHRAAHDDAELRRIRRDSLTHAKQAEAVTAETKRLMERRTTTLRERAERAEAALERVRALADQLDEFAENALKESDRKLYAAIAHDLRSRAALDEPGPAATQATQPEIITDRATIRAALDEPGCTCTYGNRCPNCRD